MGCWGGGGYRLCLGWMKDGRWRCSAFGRLQIGGGGARVVRQGDFGRDSPEGTGTAAAERTGGGPT